MSFHVLRHIDWLLLGAAALIVSVGLVTMYSFRGENIFFARQIVWGAGAITMACALSFIDFHFLRRPGVLVGLFGAFCVLLLFLIFFGTSVRGVQSWLDLGSFRVQPADPAKLVLILLLAKYFSRRHIEIAHVRHILVSGFYAGVLFLLVLLQPDFGSAIIIASLWLGMVAISGISKRHLALVLATGLLGASTLWLFVFEDYQRARLVSFLNPMADLQGAGYNAYQSVVAIGSGGLFGKGIGFGSQSRLRFLPEYETDFIFAAFAEEWGFIGVVMLCALFAIIIWRLLRASIRGATNFETLFAAGLAVLIMSHATVHIGMNLGLLPVTGTPLPFMSYGGSHLFTEFIGIGILMGMRRYGRATHRSELAREEVDVTP
ncbi:MAG: rod shape-determining protein RodA [bacterium]|nr:rod shape-determining protein RodA [bacterium]MDZ4284532.1 rod shape-determining protein RodA [Patescibacteria group bacterium]